MYGKRYTDSLVSLKYNEIIGALSHADEEHMSLELRDNLDKIFLHGKQAQSQFVKNIDTNNINEINNIHKNKSYGEETVEDVILYCSSQITEWMNSGNPKDNKMSFKAAYNENEQSPGICLVRNRNNGKLYAYEANEVTICLRKNPALKYGFELVTAYPSIKDGETKNAKKIELDLTQEIKRTKAYENADAITRAKLVYETNPSYSKIANITYNKSTGQPQLHFFHENKSKGIKINQYVSENSISMKITKVGEEPKRYDSIEALRADSKPKAADFLEEMQNNIILAEAEIQWERGQTNPDFHDE